MTTLEVLKFLGQMFIWLVTAGAALPLFVAFVSKAHWSSKIKQVIMIGSSIVLAVLFYLGDNNWQVSFADPAALVAAFGVIVTTSQTTYHGLWKQAGIADSITARMTKLRSSISSKDTVKPAILPEGAVGALPAEQTQTRTTN